MDVSWQAMILIGSSDPWQISKAIAIKVGITLKVKSILTQVMLSFQREPFYAVDIVPWNGTDAANFASTVIQVDKLNFKLRAHDTILQSPCCAIGLFYDQYELILASIW